MSREQHKIAWDKPVLVDWFESYICGFVSLVIVIEVVVGLLLVAIDLPTANFHISRWISVPALLIVIPVSFRLLQAIWESLQARRFPLAVAVAHWHLPMGHAARTFYGFVWALYSALALTMSFGMTRGLHTLAANGLETLPMFGLCVITLSMTLLANVLVALFLTALTGKLDAARIFCRWRFLVDLAITGTVLAGALR